MDKFNRLKGIIETYERFQPRFQELGIELGETEGGFWIPTRFEHAVPFLEYALRRGLIVPGFPIVDAGSGDGRMSALFDVYGFRPIINIESDKRFVDASGEVIDDLVKRGVVTDSVKTFHGDFTQLQTYLKSGTPFHDIPNFYDGINSISLRRLANLIGNNSRAGTKLIVYGMINEGEEPKLSLKLEDRIRTNDQIADFLVYKK